ncbi:MAG: hypothetical protein ACYDBB_01355 [Armatimonadota bacterium]
MSEIVLELRFPHDEDGYFRRECPFCQRQFKVPVGETLDTIPDNDETQEFYCPYCAQQSRGGTWWTQEQVDYIHDVQQNAMNGLLNEHFVRPLQRANRSNSCVKITANELPEKDSWLPVDANDMKLFNLPCCEKSLKVAEDWTDKIVCHYCGFPHS